MIRSLEKIIESRGKPAALRCDDGSEYISAALVVWATKNKITLIYIQPGRLQLNACIEGFNQTTRHERPNLHLFKSLDHAHILGTYWVWEYSNERPHTAIGGVTPRQLLLTV